MELCPIDVHDQIIVGNLDYLRIHHPNCFIVRYRGHGRWRVPEYVPVSQIALLHQQLDIVKYLV